MSSSRHNVDKRVDELEQLNTTHEDHIKEINASVSCFCLTYRRIPLLNYTQSIYMQRKRLFIHDEDSISINFEVFPFLVPCKCTISKFCWLRAVQLQVDSAFIALLSTFVFWHMLDLDQLLIGWLQFSLIIVHVIFHN